MSFTHNLPTIAVDGRPLRRTVWYAAWLVPLAAGPVWAVLLRETGLTESVASVTGFVMISLLAATSYTDVRWKRIPNWATYSAIGWALGINALASAVLSPETLVKIRPDTGGFAGNRLADTFAYLGPIGFVESLSGAGVCLGAMLVVYLFSGQGAGDAKLATAMGAILGPERGFFIVMWSHLIAGAVVLVWALWRISWPKVIELAVLYVGVVPPGSREMGPTPSWKWLLHRPVPLAPFFALGTAATLLGIFIP